MKVKQAMHAGAQWVEPGASLTELAPLMREHNIGAVAIGERLVGMVTDRNIVCRGLAAGPDPTKAIARDMMSKASFAAATRKKWQMRARSRKSKVRRLPLISEDKRGVGVLSAGEISRISERVLCGRSSRP